MKLDFSYFSSSNFFWVFFLWKFRQKSIRLASCIWNLWFCTYSDLYLVLMKHLSLLGTGFYYWNSYYDLFWVFIFELNTTWYEFCLNWHSMLLNKNNFEYHCCYSYSFIILAKETWWALYMLSRSFLSISLSWGSWTPQKKS